MTIWIPSMVAFLHLLILCWGERYCEDYLVSGPDGVSDSALSASSYHEHTIHHHDPACGRLNMFRSRESSGCHAPNIAGWCSSKVDVNPTIQVEFADLKRVVGIVVQNRRLLGWTDNDVGTFNVMYSKNGEDWQFVKSKDGVPKTFNGPGSSDENVKRWTRFSSPIIAQFVLIRPLTWRGKPTFGPCLRFDVLGCPYDTGRRRFAYLPLPAGHISDSEVITEEHANDLRECSIRCHRDTTCRAFSYSDTYRQCKAYNVNKYTRQGSGVDKKISDKQYIYFFDMTPLDLYMTTDPETGLLYKVITRKYTKQMAMAACADFDMRLLVVNSWEKLDLLKRVTSSNLVLGQRQIMVNGGYYAIAGVSKWWDGGDPPQPVNEDLLQFGNTTNINVRRCLRYTSPALQSCSCASEQYSICEILEI